VGVSQHICFPSYFSAAASSCYVSLEQLSGRSVYATYLYFTQAPGVERLTVQGRLFLNVVVEQSATVLQLFSSKNEALLFLRNALLLLNLSLDDKDRV
jgi:hypothetical protein